MKTQDAVKNPWHDGGQWIKSLRMGAEVTLAEAAEQVGAPSGEWLAQVEAGMRPVPSSLYSAFAALFGMKVRDFAARCLSHYDLKAYEALFQSDRAEIVPMQARAA
jgi:transcriptional regulator with XRE-family HTH domain